MITKYNLFEGLINDQHLNFYMKKMKSELKTDIDFKHGFTSGFNINKLPEYTSLSFYFEEISIDKILKTLDKYSKILFKADIYMAYKFQDEYNMCYIYFKSLVTQRLKPEKYVYHSTATYNRESILEKGLIPKPFKESSEWSDLNMDYLTYPPAIFATNKGLDNVWRSSGDLWQIDTTNLPNKWWYDLNFFGGTTKFNSKRFIMTFEPIPPQYLTLIRDGKTI